MADSWVTLAGVVPAAQEAVGLPSVVAAGRLFVPVDPQPRRPLRPSSAFPAGREGLELRGYLLAFLPSSEVSHCLVHLASDRDTCQHDGLMDCGVRVAVVVLRTVREMSLCEQRSPV